MTYHVKSEDKIIDIAAQKEIKRTDENCDNREDYSYFGIPQRESKLDKSCQVIKVYIAQISLKDLLIASETMKGSLNYSAIEKPSCKATNDFLFEVGLSFAVNASVYRHPNCLGNDKNEISMSQFMKFNQLVS